MRPPPIVAALIGGGALAGCSGSSTGHAGTAVGGASVARPDALAFAKCMRANGVANFPDPSTEGRFFPSRSGLAAPAVKAADARCREFLPSGGAGATFSERALVQLQKIAVCMRGHGVPDFPDPRKAARTTSPGPTGSGYAITIYRGVLLEFPVTTNRLSPEFKQAAGACGAAFLARR